MLLNQANCNICENTGCLIKKNIASALMQEFIQQKNTIICKKGQQFIMEGAPVSGLFFMNKGKAKVLKTGIYGREQILRFVKEGEIIGHRGFGTQNKYSVSALAMEDSVLCNFTSEVLSNMLQNVPKLTYDFMLFYAEELNTSETKVKAFAQMTVREKVIDALLYIQRKFGENYKGLLSMQLSRKDIADFAGTTDEQVIRTISTLKREGLLITVGKNIGVVNSDKLKKEISEHNYYLNT
ncbi:MAG: transcriptional regulator [Bacteroidales bacterium]|nr:MAG: transcriptional regulator [Bacteroidales bacterium]